MILTAGDYMKLEKQAKLIANLRDEIREKDKIIEELKGNKVTRFRYVYKNPDGLYFKETYDMTGKRLWKYTEKLSEAYKEDGVVDRDYIESIFDGLEHERVRVELWQL